MESEGPYKSERWECQNEFVVVGPGWETVGSTMRRREAEVIAKFANIAWSAGRASRDGLREALDAIFCLSSVETADCVEIAVKALEADGEVK